MRLDKQKAIDLRKDGKSYQEISKAIDVPKSTLSNWFGGVAWSKKTKDHLSELARINAKKRMTIISHKRRAELKKNYFQQKLIAEKQFKIFIKERLFVAGLTAYWGEGDNKLENGQIRISNSDPMMLKLFYKFLNIYLSEISQKAKIYLVLYPDLKEKNCLDHWSKKVGIPLDRFMKSSFIKGHCPTKRLAYGIGTLVISNRLYKEQIITWVSLIKKENITRV